MNTGYRMDQSGRFAQRGPPAPLLSSVGRVRSTTGVPIDRRPHSYAVARLGRSLHLLGRVKIPSAATLQMKSRSSRLRVRKNQAFHSVIMVSAYSPNTNTELGKSPIGPDVSPSPLLQVVRLRRFARGRCSRQWPRRSKALGRCRSSRLLACRYTRRWNSLCAKRGPGFTSR